MAGQSDRGVVRIPVTFEKGVWESQESSRIPPGTMASILNWVAEPSGELRVRQGWQTMTTDRPADGGGIIYTVPKIVGIGYSPYGGRRWAVAHRGSATTIRVLVLQLDGNPGDAPPGHHGSLSGWQEIGFINVTDWVHNLTSRAAAFATGVGRLWVNHEDGVGLHAYDGTTFSLISGSPPGRAVAVHKNRVYVGGNPAVPYRLYYSDINAATSGTNWGANNYIEVGDDDGEFIEDIEPFGDDLLITKAHSAWLLSGEGKESFSLHRLLDGEGAMGRSIVPTPYGAIILGDHDIWVYDGSNMNRISTPVENSWNPSTHDQYSPPPGSGGGSQYLNPPVSGAFLGPKCYMTDQTTIFVYDFETQAWTTETCADTVGTLASRNRLLLMGPSQGLAGSMLNFRANDTPRERDYSESIEETFSAETPEILADGPIRSLVFRHVELVLRQRGTGVRKLKITPTIDGVAYPVFSIPVGGEGLQRMRLDFPGTDGYACKLLFTQELGPAPGQGPTYDIEQCYIVVTPTGYDR